jgi:hypothetical protein
MIYVGVIARQLENKDGGAVCVYIMTLGVLAPYCSLCILFAMRLRYALAL